MSWMLLGTWPLCALTHLHALHALHSLIHRNIVNSEVQDQDQHVMPLGIRVQGFPGGTAANSGLH